jgi:hypothetical protein
MLASEPVLLSEPSLPQVPPSAPSMPSISALFPAAPPSVPGENGQPASAAPDPTTEAPARGSQPPNGGAGNQELVVALKQIVGNAKKGKVDEAYKAYAELFGSTRFAEYRPEDQRQAMRIMVLAKQQPPPNDIVREAHRIASERLRTLIALHDHAADYEMLGVCQIVLDDTKAASAAFSSGLELERARNPGSELCGNLMRRAASI